MVSSTPRSTSARELRASDTDLRRKDYLARVWRGGYPEAFHRETPRRRERFFDGYLSDIIARDVKQVAGSAYDLLAMADAERSGLAVPAPRLVPRVTFEDLVRARYGPEYGAYRDAFEAEHGEIYRQYYSREPDGGAIVLTVPTRRRGAGEPEMFFIPPSTVGDANFRRILFQADQIAIEADRLLSGANLRRCLVIVHSALQYMFELTDSVERDAAYNLISDQLGVARSFYLRAVARRAVLLYLEGMAASVGLVSAILVGLYFLIVLHNFALPVDPRVIGPCIGAGGLGATLSVMIRMSQGKLAIPSDATDWETVFVGGFRPFIGAISGVAVYVLVASQLLPLSIPAASASTRLSSWAFFVGVAFAAGFSERLLTDALVRAEGQVSSTSAAQVTGAPGGNQAR